jgi:hypothetical protein
MQGLGYCGFGEDAVAPVADTMPPQIASNAPIASVTEAAGYALSVSTIADGWAVYKPEAVAVIMKYADSTVPVIGKYETGSLTGSVTLEPDWTKRVAVTDPTSMLMQLDSLAKAGYTIWAGAGLIPFPKRASASFVAVPADKVATLKSSMTTVGNQFAGGALITKPPSGGFFAKNWMWIVGGVVVAAAGLKYFGKKRRPRMA